MKITVVGAGSWGTALAELADRCGHDVLLWAYEEEVVQQLKESRSNPLFLPSAKFSYRTEATNSLEEAANFSSTVMMVTPSHHYRRILGQLKEHLPGPIRIISGTKGIENDTLKRVSEICDDVLGDEALTAFACLSGPTFAAELSRADPTAAVVASSDAELAREVQEAFSCQYFRLYTTDDVVGVEIGNSMKNVMAIAAGIIEGIGLGYNTTAALITRGLHEMGRLSEAMGGRPDTLAGLAGMGDLILTCTGALSRNRRLGTQLGQGKSLEQILSETREVAEGVKTTRSAKDLADKLGIEMPITQEMFRVLYENENPRIAIQRLMTRALKSEVE
jgi:glycerol-3-phosphate dehydrogenase (NAD(P)+)